MAPKCRKRSAGADGCAKIERTILHHCLKLCFVTQPRCQAFSFVPYPLRCQRALRRDGRRGPKG